MQSNYISIESGKRKSGVVNNFVVDTVINNAKSFSVKSIAFTNNIYNITQFNNKIYFYDRQGDRTATLIPGNYSAGGLAHAIQVSMLAAKVNPAFSPTCEYIVGLNKFRFKDVDTTGGPPGNWELRWDYSLNENQTLYKNLGFEPLNYTGQNEYVSPYQINLTSVVYCDVVSNQLGKRLKNNNLMQMNAIERLFMSKYNYGENVVFEPKYRRVFEFNPDISISQIDIQLIDNYGRLLQLDNNIDVVILLECFYV